MKIFWLKIYYSSNSEPFFYYISAVTLNIISKYWKKFGRIFKQVAENWAAFI